MSVPKVCNGFKVLWFQPTVQTGCFLFVATDKELEFIRDMELRVQSLCKSPGFPEIMGFRAISCTSENEGLEALRRLIVDLIET